jgi:hypothetical protein
VNSSSQASVSRYDGGWKWGTRQRIYLAKVSRKQQFLDSPAFDRADIREPAGSIMKKEIRLNAFAMNCVAHQSPGLWTHPRDRTIDYNRLPYWTHLAKTLERGRFDGLFLADVLGVYDVAPAPMRRCAMRRRRRPTIPCC